MFSKLNNVKCCLLLVGILGSRGLIAQVVPPVTPTTGTPIPASGPVSEWVFNATVKYGVLDPLSGKIGLYFQPEFSPMAAVEIGLGITRKNHFFEAATGTEENNGYFLSDFNSPHWKGENMKDLEDFFYDYDFRKVKTGAFVSVMPKLQFSSFASPQTSFIGCRFEYRRYNWRADGVYADKELNYNPAQQFKEMERQLNVIFVYGGQFSGGGFVFEWYAGAGTRYFYMKKRDIGIEYKGTPEVPEYGAVLSTFKKTSGMIEAGVNIGFRFGQ
ncbi:MAG: hypothetical protein JNL88_11325 [Bacteroidia bacterium]|nr:hypothetical protein [Bacteroidia bacterium]